MSCCCVFRKKKLSVAFGDCLSVLGWLCAKKAVLGWFGRMETVCLIFYLHSGSPCGLVRRVLELKLFFKQYIFFSHERHCCPEIVVTTYFIIHFYIG